MRVLLLGNYEPDRQQSMQRLSRMFRQLLEKKGVKVGFVRPRRMFNRSGDSTRGFSKLLGYLDKYCVFPFILRKRLRDYDVLHIADHSNALYLHCLSGMPSIVTCCDMLAIRSALGEIEENRTGWSGRILQRMILGGLRKADRAVCISEATRKDLLRIAGPGDMRAETVYLGMNYPYKPMEPAGTCRVLDRIGIGPDTPFFLNVGQNNWYKNRTGLIDIFVQLAVRGREEKLVLAGKAPDAGVNRKIKESGMDERVVRVVGPDNRTLRALYSGAAALLYPSIEEGFGWPVIEAQACGCPVFTTGKQPMTEAGGEAAVYFDPSDPGRCARVIDAVLKAPDRVREMVRKGLENVEKFSGDTMIEQYIRIYKDTVKDHGGGGV